MRVAKNIDNTIADLRALNTPQEKFENVLQMLAKLAVEIDALYEMREKDGLEDMREEIRKMRKS